MSVFKPKTIAALGAVAVMSFAFLTIHQVPATIPVVSASSADFFLKLDGIEGAIEVDSYSWGVKSPRDSASGQATGKRQYQPLIIRKRIDKASPLLFKMVNDGKRAKQLVLSGTDASGNSISISFFDIFIEEYNQSGASGSPPTESLSFTYQKIEWTTR